MDLAIRLLASSWAVVRSYLGAAIAAVSVLGMLLYAGRRHGRIEAERDALKTEQQTRNRADEAAADASRDGADRRLRDGRF